MLDWEMTVNGFNLLASLMRKESGEDKIAKFKSLSWKSRGILAKSENQKMPLSSQNLRGERILDKFIKLKNWFELKNVKEVFLLGLIFNPVGTNREKENELDVKKDR